MPPRSGADAVVPPVSPPKAPRARARKAAPPAVAAPPPAGPLPDWVEAILDEPDDPGPRVPDARRKALDALPSDRKRLIVVVTLYGPISVADAIKIAVPGATRARSTGLAASLANLAAEGLIDKLGPGLYDAVMPERGHMRPA